MTLEPSAQGYGIAICGASGEETDAEVQPKGVYISCLTKHSPASRDGRLAVGDQVRGGGRSLNWLYSYRVNVFTSIV